MVSRPQAPTRHLRPQRLPQSYFHRGFFSRRNAKEAPWPTQCKLRVCPTVESCRLGDEDGLPRFIEVFFLDQQLQRIGRTAHHHIDTPLMRLRTAASVGGRPYPYWVPIGSPRLQK